jgi:PAS domain S-box-containing protein
MGRETNMPGAPSAEGLAEPQRFPQAVLDALSAHIAVLDEQGGILAVNGAWRRFAAGNGYAGAGCGLGENYLEVCERSGQGGVCGEGRAAAEGIRDVLAGRREAFELDYPCHGQAERRWFLMRVTRFSTPGPARAVVAHEDITARKLAEETLLESAKQLRLVTDNVPVFIVYCDADRRYRFVNRGYAERFGFRPEDVIGRRIAEVVGEEAYRSFERHVDAALAGRAVEFEMEVPYPDLGRRFMRCAYVPDRDAGGAVRGFVAVIGDATERWLAEERLRESEERFRSMSDSAPVMIWVAGVDKRCNFFNQPWLDFTGRRMEQELGEGWADGVHPDDSDRCLNLYAASFDARREFQLEYRLRRRDGEYRWVLSRGRPRFGSDGSFEGYIGSCIDITEQRAAVGALAEREERLRLAVDAAHLGTWDWDIRSDRSVWGGYHAQLFGMPGRTSVTYEEFMAMIHPEDRATVNEATARAVAGSEEYHVEFRVVRPDGAVRWMRDQGIAYRDESGRARRMTGVVQDITAAKRSEVERDLRLAQERELREVAEAASRSKDEFLAVISHELRSPLNAMLGWTRVLQNRLEDPATLAHGLEVIERSARAQQRLIEDLLDTARIISGKMRLETGPVDLISVVHNALEVVRPAAEARGIEVGCDLDARADLITGDAERLQQVVWNLLSNAIKFTPERGRVEVRLERADPFAQLSVSDTGVGIVPEFLPHIFNRFHQADSSSTRRHGGLGLGLALVRHLVELHGGTVCAESAGAGRGATFIVRLPLRAVRVRQGSGFGVPGSESKAQDARLSTPNAERRTRSATLAGLSALVVDDDQDARDIVAILLRQLGADVTAVASADEALGRLAGGGALFDVLVSDLSMPETDGYEFIRRVRELEVGRRLPAIALTAFSRPEDRVQALLAGFQTHLTKPVELSELAAVIAALTGRAGHGMNA